MSDSTVWVIVAVVVVVAAAAAFFVIPGADTEVPPPVVIETLEAWVEFTQRPGFKLLEKRALKDYFIAVYRTPADEVAFCYRWRGEGDEPSTSLGVREGGGGDLRDSGRTEDETALNPTGPLPAGGFVQGMVIPIRRDYEGDVMLIFLDNRDDRDAKPDREAFLRTVEWSR
ncbi:MAG: hypothetical protein QNJ90_13265 [Planctomycetota bacterium]|nr:hypothetical protein [Planctomycetota bacterium]